MSNLEKVTMRNLEEKVLNSDIPILVEFTTPRCPSCSVMEGVLEEVSGEYAGRMNIVQIDLEQERDLGSELGITAVPTMVLFKDGAPVDGIVGAVPARTLRERLNRSLDVSAAEACGGTG